MKHICLLLCVILTLSLFLTPGMAQSAKVLGQTVDDTTTSLSFEKLEPREAYQMAEKITAYPNVKTVVIQHPHMSVHQLIKLRSLAPEVHFIFHIRWNSVEINTDDALIDLGKQRDIAFNDLMELIPLLPNVTEMHMFGMRISIRNLERLTETYPSVHFHTLVPVSNLFFRDDSTALSTRHSAGSPRDNSEYYAQCLCYLPDLQALDIGHNRITTLDFLTMYPKMKVLILADNKIDDISPLAKLPELEYLELFMNQISDLSPLSTLTQLKDVNLTYNEIADLTPLYSLTQLERLWISENPVSEEQIAALREALPNTEIVTGINWSTGGGWRDHPRYQEIRTMFDNAQFVPFAE